LTTAYLNPRRPLINLLIKAVIILITLTLAVPPVPWIPKAEASDWAISGGHYFSQAGGYAVVNKDGVPFWNEYQRLGGVQAVGYPISQRFYWDGFVVQAMQRVVFQWRPEVGQVYFLNVFDLMSQAGKDEWLEAARQTPRPLPDGIDAGKSWDRVVRERLALLNTNPAIRNMYYSVVGDPVVMNGLPTSQVMDMGNNYTLRAQRVVIQQWKENVPWAAAGQVTVALGGSIAAEAGLIPSSALTAESSTAPAPPSPAVAAPQASAQAMDIINAYRAAAGVAPANFNQQLAQAAGSHVAYYDANRGDSSLAGMGLHNETSGRAGFSGPSFADRARAAGYSGGTVTENAGFGGVNRAIEWYMNTVNHRLPLIHPSALDMGYAESASSGFNIIDVGVRRDKLSTPLPSVYPGDGAYGVPTAWDGGESPDPAPGLPRPLGYPITVAFGVYQKVEWGNIELRGPSGESVAINTPRKDWMRAVAIIPHRPLAPNSTYTAVVETTVDGKPAKKEWRFTTGG